MSVDGTATKETGSNCSDRKRSGAASYDLDVDLGYPQGDGPHNFLYDGPHGTGTFFHALRAKLDNGPDRSPAEGGVALCAQIAGRRPARRLMAKPRAVACPTCGTAVPWTPQSRWRPFCSERCKMIDVGAWASESYRVPTADAPDPNDSDPGGDETKGR